MDGSEVGDVACPQCTVWQTCSHQCMMKSLDVPHHLPSSNLTDMICCRMLVALISAKVDCSANFTRLPHHF